MLKFIWQNWWRQRERFILLIVGALIISSGLSYLVGLSESNKGTIVDTLQKRWSASYDIVVRPKGARSVTEEKQLLEPNYLSGLSGGISIEQYEKIKALSEVETAAPIAMVGYAGYEVRLKPLSVTQKGVYRVNIKEVTNNGAANIVDNSNLYFPQGDWDAMNKGPEYGVVASYDQLKIYTNALLAGIDPEQEAKLVGLDSAVIEKGESRYFTSDDQSSSIQEDGLSSIHEIPVIVSNQAFIDRTSTFTIERLNLPFDKQDADTTMETIKTKGGETYLDSVKGSVVQRDAFTSEEAFNLFVKSATGIDFKTGKQYEGVDAVNQEFGEWINMKPSPLQYEPVTSPFPERWPFAYEVKKHSLTEKNRLAFLGKESFRIPNMFGRSSDDWPRIRPKWIGFYDPGKLDISKDPTTELPMETYRPATADLVLDKNRDPVNPAKSLKPTDNPYDFLASPPVMMTTIDAAQDILGDKPISSIRVKVAGVSDLSEASQKKLEAVANQIEAETGLITDITLGSSPQPTLTHVPALSDTKEIGWLQQPWVKIGSSMSIFREAKLGFAEVIASVMAVAVIYVWASSLVSLLARRKQFAVLLAIGWRPNQLAKMLFVESALVGSFVAIISWIILGSVIALGNSSFSLERFLLTGLFGLLVYLLGAIIPAGIARNISPYETMNTGEISKSSKRLLGTRGVFSMACNHLAGKWKRSLLSILAIALPTGFLAFFLFITIRLKGVMYTTWLGQYAALEVGTMHYIAMGVALLIAMLTTVEIMWQNVSERSGELSLLTAIGWRSGNIRLMILLEGIVCGMLAGVIGLVLAISMMWGMYREFPAEHLGFILMTGIIPVVTGLLGAILPAEKAVRINPSRGITGQYTNKKSADKKVKWVLAVSVISLFAGLLFVMIKAAPQLEKKSEVVAVSKETVTPTKGKTADGDDAKGSQDSKKPKKVEYMSVANEEYDATISLGNDLKWNILTFKVEKINKLPNEMNIKEPAKGKKQLYYQITLKNKDTQAYEFRPNVNFKLQTLYDSISPIEAVSIKSEGLDNRYLSVKGSASTLLIFEIPKGEQEQSLLFKSRNFRKGILVNLN